MVGVAFANVCKNCSNYAYCCDFGYGSVRIALEQVLERHEFNMCVLLVFLGAFAVAVVTVAMMAVVFVMRMALVIVRNFTELEQTDFLVFFVAEFAKIMLIHNAVGGKEYHQSSECSQYCICQFHRCKGSGFFDRMVAINKTLSLYG